MQNVNANNANNAVFATWEEWSGGQQVFTIVDASAQGEDDVIELTATEVLILKTYNSDEKDASKIALDVGEVFEIDGADENDVAAIAAAQGIELPVWFAALTHEDMDDDAYEARTDAIEDNEEEWEEFVAQVFANCERFAFGAHSEQE